MGNGKSISNGSLEAFSNLGNITRWLYSYSSRESNPEDGVRRPMSLTLSSEETRLPYFPRGVLQFIHLLPTYEGMGRAGRRSDIAGPQCYYLVGCLRGL